MKKFLSFFLAILMITAVFPFSAFVSNAAEATSNLTIVYNGNTVLGNYASLDAAFEALEPLYAEPLADNTITDKDGDGNIFNELYTAAGSPVIKVNKSYTETVRSIPNWAVNGYNKNKVITIVVDGQGNTISCGAISILDHLAFYNFTMRNTTLKMSDCNYDNNIVWNGNAVSSLTPGESFTLFENCIIDQNSTLAAGSTNGSLFKLNGKAKAWQDADGDNFADSNETYNDTVLGDKYNLTLKDSTVTCATAVGIQVHWGADANIKLINTSLTLDGTGGGSSNSEAIKFYEAGKIDLYVDGRSTVASVRSSGSKRSTLINVLTNMGSAVSIVLGKGAKLVLNNPSTLTEASRMLINTGKGPCTIADLGAIWTISANDAKIGVIMPSIVDGIDGATMREFNVGGTVVAGGSTYKNTSATASVNATPILAKSLYIVGPDLNIGYDSINDAFTWVYNRTSDSSDYTIYLYKNVTTAKSMYPTSYDHKNVKTIRVDGNGYTLTSTASGADTGIFYGIGLYNLKLNNIKLISSAAEGLNWSPRLHGATGFTSQDSYSNYIATGSNPVVDTYAEFTNVTYTPASGVSGGTIKLKGGNASVANTGTYYITMTDCTFTSTKADTMFMMNDGARLNLTLVGTTLNHENGSTGNSANNYMFAMNGSDVTIKASSSATRNTVFNESSSASNSYNGNGIFFIENSNKHISKVDITIGSGTQLIIDGVSARQAFIGELHEKVNLTYTDYGATYKATKAALTSATTGIDLSNFPTGWAWHINDTLQSSTKYKNTSAMADVIFQNKQNYTYIETANGSRTYYRSIDNAVDNLDALYDSVAGANLTNNALWEAAGSPIVYVCQDATVTATANSAHVSPSWWSSDYNPDRVRTVHIKGAPLMDGSRPTVTYTYAGSFIRYNAYYNLTLEDINIDCTSGFAIFWSGYNGGRNSHASTTNVRNCNIAAMGTSSEGVVFKVTGNQRNFYKTVDGKSVLMTDPEEIANEKRNWTENYTINFENVYVNAKGGSTDADGVNAVFLLHHGAAGVLNIDKNCVVEHNMAKNYAGGDTMFMVGTPRSFEINIESGAKLKAHISKVSTIWKSYQMFNVEDSNTYWDVDESLEEINTPKAIINIEDGVEITITADSGYQYPAYVLVNRCSSNYREVIFNFGKGVKYTFDANAAKNGFGLFKGVPYRVANGERDLLYIAKTNSGKELILGPTVLAGKVSENIVSITPVRYSDDDFRMLYGASLRTVKNQNGIRFTALFSDELTELIESYGLTMTYGMMIAPGSTIKGDPTVHSSAIDKLCNPALTVKDYKIGELNGEDVTADNAYHVAILMPYTEKSYNLDLAARAYFEITFADGTVQRYYTDMSEDSIRSMTTVANNLLNKDPERYYQNQVVAEIVYVTNENATGLVESLAGGEAIYDSGVSTKEVVLKDKTKANRDTIIDAFKSDGYSLVSATTVNGARFEVNVLKSRTSTAIIYWIPNENSSEVGEVRIIWERLREHPTELLTPNSTSKEGTMEVVQVGISRQDETDNPLIGMCYVIKLSNGHGIIIDGGFMTEACADTLYRTIEELGIAQMSDGRYAIDAWILTHGHRDHIGTLLSMSMKYRDNIWLHYIVHNLGPTSNGETTGSFTLGEVTYSYKSEAEYDSLLDYAWPDSSRVNVHAGLTYYFGNIAIEMISSPDILYDGAEKIGYYNDSSLMFKVTAGKDEDASSILFFGDAGEVAATKAWTLYDEIAFKSDIFQATHHGLYTAANSGFTWEYVEKIYTATGANIAFLPMGTMYQAGNRNGRYDVLIGWSRGVDKSTDPVDYDRMQISYFTDHTDTKYIGEAEYSRDIYESFIAEVEAGKYTGTFFGYNGGNLIDNGEGLITYINSTETEVMYTQFTLGNGCATLVKNVAVSEL